MSLLHQAPRLAIAEAVHLARELYGLDARASPLPSERDQNFLLDTPEGRFVLKLANAADTRELLEAQVAALAHLATRVPFCPRVIPAGTGEAIVREPGGHFVRLVTWLPGIPLAAVRHHSSELLRHVGRSVADLDRALADFDHPALHREFYWDLAGAVERSRQALQLVEDGAWRALVARELDRIERRLQPRVPAFRASIVHNDVNDYNVLVNRSAEYEWRVSGIIDFGDMVRSYTVADPAVAIAYAILDRPDPLCAAAGILAAYHQVHPLLEDEIEAVFDLVELRLCLSATVAARQQAERPDDGYLRISQQAIRTTLPALAAIHPRFAEAALRHACGLTASPRAARIAAWLAGRQPADSPVLGEPPLDAQRLLALDLSVSSPIVAGDPEQNAEPVLTKGIQQAIDAAGASIGLGGYLEPRILYCSPLFEARRGDRRTVHLGLDFFAPPGTPVMAALPGIVHAVADHRQPLDSGPVVILRHITDDGEEFFTLYAHLSRESLYGLTSGAVVRAGDSIGAVGSADVNGGWTPHLHFQVIADLLELDCDYPGMCRDAERPVWAELSPDPNLIVRLPASALVPRPPDRARTLTARQAHIGSSVRPSYRQPLKIVRGWMQFLYDDTGRRYLDAYNNVPHLGHCHPDVVRAAAEQMRALNTNTRYLHDVLARFAGELTATLPAPLRLCYFVNSGSEANELALRLARAHTHARDVIVLESAYHGNTTTLIDISPYKFDGPGGEGKPPWVHVARVPDLYRGPFRADDPDAARKYAADVAALLERAGDAGRAVGAFIAETCPSVAGQLMLPDGYLALVYSHVRAAGGVCIADEVQTAYGRTGTHFYAFEAHRVIPDIVVLGKPIGNGYPIGAVVTTPEIARSFETGMEFFSTFGGSTVSCAVGLAVLRAARRQQVQAHAARVGDLLMSGLRELARARPCVGDVRGSGLFLGVELVADPQTREPATALAAYVVNRLRDEGILIGTEGRHDNVLKIRPPMPFDDQDAQVLVSTLDRVLDEA